MAISTNEKYMKAMERNPMELYAYRNASGTLAIENSLSRAGEDNDENTPLKIFSRMSRFHLVLIDNKATENKSGSANLSPKDVPGLIRKSRFCYNRDLQLAMQMASPDQERKQSVAYTQVLSTGTGMRGKTPAQFLLEAGSDQNAVQKAREALTEQYKWLRRNLKENPDSRYAAGNKAQMDAIVDAMNLQKEGKLEASSRSSASYTLFSSGPRPLMSRAMHNGKNFVYDYKITWTFGNNYPVTVTIKNFYAPVIRTKSGTVNVQCRDKEDERTYSIKMSADEWMYALHMIETNMRTFENSYGATAFGRANGQQIRNRMLHSQAEGNAAAGQQTA